MRRGRSSSPSISRPRTRCVRLLNLEWTADLVQPFNLHLAEDEAVLKGVHVSGDNLVLLYSRDVRDELLLYDLKTAKKIGRIAENLVGVISGPSGRREHDEVRSASTCAGEAEYVRTDVVPV